MEYAGLAVVFLLALLIALGQAFLNDLIGYRKPDPMEDYPYECGVPLYDESVRGRFKQGYYLLGLLLILFDIEAAYLFPWAVVFEEIGLYGLVEALLFVGILALGFLYAWRKGALDWEL
ncbi:MAG: NADH-quinone oxidoreductase subunit A [Aquificae bacterium]|nr:NADH-quinone oxidoreductase subunit A [Aquificota bacterium]